MVRHLVQVLLFVHLMFYVHIVGVYLTSVVIFELGSLFCGIARNVNFLIFGRAVAGLGGAGIYVSIFTIIAQTIRLKDRPVYIGFFGGVFGMSSVCLIADVMFRKTYDALLGHRPIGGTFTLFGHVDYLPIVFQAVRHHTAERSGIDIILPYMLTMVVTLILSGGFVRRVGRHWSLLHFGHLYIFGPRLVSHFVI
jgi:hypothetical protein